MKDEVDEDEAGASSSGSIAESTISYGNPRASRNMAEKQRRDNLNTNISTMAALVPAVAESSRRMDKISILRLSAAYLRTKFTLGPGTRDFLPPRFKDFDLEQYFVDNMIGSGGFLLIVTSTGTIVYISRQVEQQLGHVQNELLGQSLYSFVHPDDHEELTRNLTPDEMQRANGGSTLQISDISADNNSSSSEDSAILRNDSRPFQEQRRSFQLRMSQRTVSRREHTQYECLHVSGILRLAEACKNLENRTRHRETTSTSNDIVFVGVARLLKKRIFTELSLLEANKDEYVTRHLLDGRIIFCDHRISVVAGYMSEEVSGISAFRFMHKDDSRWTMIGLRQMYDRGEGYGSSCYRLLSKNGEFIYLRTHGYLEFDEKTQTVESFVCINMLVSPEEGAKLVKEMKNRFSATITGSTRAMIDKVEDVPSFELGSDSQRSNSKASLEDPFQLEDAITHLIGDLPSPAISEDCLSPSPIPNTQFVKAKIYSQRLPPASTQASKIGIKKIDQCLVLHGKGSRVKQESSPVSAGPEYPIGNSTPVNANSVERTTTMGGKQMSNGTSESPDSRESGKNLSMLDSSSRDSRDSTTSGKNLSMLEQSNDVLNVKGEVSSPASVVQCDSVSNSNSNQFDFRPNVAQDPAVKFENAIEGLVRLEEQEESSFIGFLENGPEEAIHSDSETPQRHYPLKRSCSGNDLNALPNKRKIKDIAYVPLEPKNGEGLTYFTDNEFSVLPVDFNGFEQATSQPLKPVQSPDSSLHEASIDYQQLEPAAPYDELHDLKDDQVLLGADLDANPDIMMKIFDDLRPVMSFEKNFVETKVQQLSANDQVINEEIRRTHLQLANSMALRDSQFSVLARDLENPVLQAQRENLTQMQAEHTMQKQMLKTLQQEHHNMQVNVKHNIGV